jgi:putative endonuclease
VDAAGKERPGRSGEALAEEHLSRKGMVVLARNYRCRAGEIDLVLRDGDTVVFVEVKERTGRSHGSAVEAVTWSKRRKIAQTARVFAAVHGLSEASLRFDVVAIDWDASGPRLRHDEGAFGLD